MAATPTPSTGPLFFSAGAVPQGDDNPAPPPRHVYIFSGGIGAGKSELIKRLVADFHFVTGSPADIMKQSVAQAIAAEYNFTETGTPTDDGWESYFAAMQDQKTKAEFRLLLQGYGEFFSNRDMFYWANKAVEAAAVAYDNVARAGVQGGIAFDSIRRPQEIMAVKNRWPQAKHVHLSVSHERQIEYLTTILGYTEEKAEGVLAHSSEHWLDDMAGTDWDADCTIAADAGSEAVFIQYLGFINLNMTEGERTVAEAIIDA